MLSGCRCPVYCDLLFEYLHCDCECRGYHPTNASNCECREYHPTNISEMTRRFTGNPSHKRVISGCTGRARETPCLGKERENGEEKTIPCII